MLIIECFNQVLYPRVQINQWFIDIEGKRSFSSGQSLFFVWCVYVCVFYIKMFIVTKWGLLKYLFYMEKCLPECVCVCAVWVPGTCGVPKITVELGYRLLWSTVWVLGRPSKEQQALNYWALHLQLLDKGLYSVYLFGIFYEL